LFNLGSEKELINLDEPQSEQMNKLLVEMVLILSVL